MTVSELVADVRLTDTTLRDGSHARRHRFTVEEVRVIAGALGRVGVPVIEVAHGDGMGGSSFTYGFSLVDELELIAAAVAAAPASRVAVLVIPGIGTKDEIRAAQDRGVQIVRIATHCTEADISIQHFEIARSLGLETVGFLMMSHMSEPERLARQARIMADAGCHCVYVVDSAGALVLEQAGERVAALVAELGNDAQVGFHGHENLAVGVANSVVAIRAGARQIDASTRRLGAGAGNTPLEALVAVCQRLGIATGIDPLELFDLAEDVVRPIMEAECLLDRNALTIGYAGAYSSFLRHASVAAERYDVAPSGILLEAGRRRLVGGQEDQLLEIALQLASPDVVS